MERKVENEGREEEIKKIYKWKERNGKRREKEN